ncbi:MAG: hypothetical protein R2861_11045, partial [Desulfobacterales bacterium]
SDIRLHAVKASIIACQEIAWLKIKSAVALNSSHNIFLFSWTRGGILTESENINRVTEGFAIPQKASDSAHTLQTAFADSLD